MIAVEMIQYRPFHAACSITASSRKRFITYITFVQSIKRPFKTPLALVAKVSHAQFMLFCLLIELKYLTAFQEFLQDSRLLRDGHDKPRRMPPALDI